MAEPQEETIILLLLTYLLQLKSHIHAAVSFPCIPGMQRRQSGLKSGGGRRSGVTGQNIPPARVYPGILWPRPIYTPGYIMA